MKPFTAFLRALFQMTLRNRQALFWTFFFPVLIMAFMGFVGKSQAPLNVAVVGPAGPARTMLVKILSKSGGVHLVKAPGDAAAVRGDIRRGNLDAAVILTAPLEKDLLTALGGGPPVPLPVLYASSNYIQAQITRGAISGILEAGALGASGRYPPFYADTRAVGAQRLTYLDFITPGVVGMMIMNSALFAITGMLTRWRERGILRRLRATGISPLAILTGMIINQASVAIVSVAILIAIAIFVFKVHLFLDAASLLPISVAGIGAFLAIGLVLAGFAKTSESVAPLTNIVTLPMMFLSGIWFPVSGLPDGLRQIVSVLPLTYLVNGLRSSLLQTGTIVAQRSDVLALLVWVVVAGIVASRTFRWEQHA